MFLFNKCHKISQGWILHHSFRTFLLKYHLFARRSGYFSPTSNIEIKEYLCMTQLYSEHTDFLNNRFFLSPNIGLSKENSVYRFVLIIAETKFLS